MLSLRKKANLDYCGVICLGLFLLFFLYPCPAYAAESLLEAAMEGPAEFITYLMVGPLLSFMQDVLFPFLSNMFEWGTEWTSIPYVSAIIPWLQGLAVIAAVTIRIYVGIKSGLLQDGGSNEYSLEEYFGKSLGAIVLVAIMPTLCLLAIQFGHSVFDYVVVSTGGVSEGIAWLDVSTLNADELVPSVGIQALWLVVLVLVVFIMAIACGYQFISRQVQMLTVTIIAPIISVYAATEDNAYQVTDLLKSLLGLVLQQFLQYMLVMIALSFGYQWMAIVSEMAVSNPEGFTVLGIGSEQVKAFMFCIATFGAALTIPRLVDRYTFGAGGSRIGGIVGGMAIRGALMRLPFIGRR